MRYYLLCVLIILSFSSTFSDEPKVKNPVGIVEKLGQMVPMDVEIYDEMGNLVQLKNIIHKPTIVTFVYYECPGICSPLLTEVTKLVDEMDLELGKDYQIFTLSFDHDEKPELAASKRRNYLNEINRQVDTNGWHFYTGDSVNIRRLTNSAGFYFERNGRDWIHAGALIILSPEGKVTRYLNGIRQLPFDVKLAVLEASEGRTGPTIAKVLRFCYAYDPEGKTYALNFTAIGAIMVLGFAGIFVMIFIVRPKKNSSDGKITP